MDDVDEWVQKTTVLEQTIRGIADGTVDPDKVDLKKYGILTTDQKAEIEAEKERIKQNRVKDQIAKETLEREEEKQRWWSRVGQMHMKHDSDKNKKVSQQIEVSYK